MRFGGWLGAAPQPVVHTSHPTYGYIIGAARRRGLLPEALAWLAGLAIGDVTTRASRAVARPAIPPRQGGRQAALTLISRGLAASALGIVRVRIPSA